MKFWPKRLEYLGQVISIHRVVVDLQKASSVMDWPIQKKVKGVCGFLCITRYYQKFIKNYGKIASSLTELTKQDGFGWSYEAHKAFEELKINIATTLVLCLPNFEKRVLSLSVMYLELELGQS